MIINIFLRSDLVGLSLLSDNYYHKSKGLVCYVISFYNQYSYGRLSLFPNLLLFLDTPDDVFLVYQSTIAKNERHQVYLEIIIN